MPQAIIDKRYKILKKLGSGAMGDVYKVRDLKDKKILALKILSKKKTTSDAIQRFKREFRLLAGLRHPNLCEVYDFGMLKDGRSYFTMEYIDGPNIFEFTKNPVRKNISNGVYPLIVQLCRVLEYIHSKGLIHYDIKPGNVLIAKGKEQGVESNKKHCAQSPMLYAKLLDFGLAGEQWTRGGVLIKGTFPYIAPEVIKGLAVDHRADLYSLGVLLYEIFTRRVLYVDKKTSFATLLQQQEKSIKRLSKIEADIPKRLERLIIRLLEFEPASRFSRANEVIKEINKISCVNFALETKETIEGYLLSSRFVGRDKEMNLLQSFYKRACQGEGKVILVAGDAGIGKSRLLKEFRIFTQLRRSHSFIGHAHKDKISPLEPFYDIFSELINYIKDSPDLFRSKEFKLSLAVLFKVFPDLTDGHLKKNLPKLVPLEPKQEKLRTFEALSELIKYIASSLGELIILLEDLHWADNLTIEFLEYLGRNLENRNIFICGTCRKEELKGNLVLKRMMTNLRNEDCLSQIELGPLRFKTLYSFLDSTITPRSNSSDLVRYLMKKTGGNPFFVEEIMRTLLRKKRVSIGERVEIEDFKRISIPETIEDIVLKRLKGLDSTSQEVVKFDAVLLKDFSYDLMKRLTGLDDTELSRVLWELKRRQVLIEDGNKYRFYHATLREAVYKRLGDKERSDINYQIGRTLEKINRGRLNKIVEDLAYYFINARDRKKGVGYGLRAAKKSSERYAHEQAIRFYKGALGLLRNKDSKHCFDILLELARTEKLVGYYDDAIKHYHIARKLKTGTISKKINIYLNIASTYEVRGMHNQTLSVYRRGLRLLREMKTGSLKALFKIYINARMCRTHQIMGEYKKYTRFNFAVMKLPKRDFKATEAINMQAVLYHIIGTIEAIKVEYGRAHYDKVLFYYKKAYKYYKKINTDNRIAALFSDIGVTYYLKFDFQNAFDYYQKAIQICEKIGHQNNASVGLCNLGNILKDKGYYFKAVDCFQKALATSKKIGSHVVTGTSSLGLGECFLKLCNWSKAKEYSMQALKIYRAMNWKRAKGISMMIIGGIYQILGDYSLSLNSYRQAIKIFGDIRHQRYIADLFVKIGSVFIELGAFSKARRYVEDALEIADIMEAKNIEVECCIALCRINIIIKNYAVASDYSKKGMRIAKKIGLKRQLHQFLLLVSGIHYHEKRYLKGLKIADKSIKMAKDMGTKDLYVEALLIKTKNEIKQGVLSKIEVFKILNEAKKIAEEITCPEILWKVYFAYGRFLQDDKQYFKALDYYDKCNDIFENVCDRIKNKSYQRSYLDRPDRQAVYLAKNEIARLLD